MAGHSLYECRELAVGASVGPGDCATQKIDYSIKDNMNVLASKYALVQCSCFTLLWLVAVCMNVGS